VSTPEFSLGELLDLVEQDIARFEAALDEPIALTPGSQLPGIAAAITFRARTLYAGTRAAVDGPSEALAIAGCRMLLEAWILLRWIEQRPEQHLLMWSGEQARHIRTMLNDAPSAGGPALAARFQGDLPPGLAQQFEKVVEDARASNRADHVSGVEAKGPLIPNFPTMVQVIGDQQISALYNWAYPWLSAFTHTGLGSFGSSISIPEPGRMDFDDGAAKNPDSLRAFAATFYLGILADGSRVLGLPIAPDVAKTRNLLTL
jgi:hypothetical protein